MFCTVTKIQYHVVTVQLDEYHKQGLIHISEVSPGRIRNIRNYVTEGKKVVCKVIRINPQREHIDLSLRRVNESQKRQKTDEIKQEQKAEKIIKVLAERTSTPEEQVYKEVAEPVLQHYPWVYLAFEEVVEKKASLASLGVKKDLASKLEELIKEKIKPKQVSIIINARIRSFDSEGVEIVKKAFSRAEQAAKDLKVNYLGAGAYRMVITAKDYKKAEKDVEQVKQAMTDLIEENHGEISFERQER